MQLNEFNNISCNISCLSLHYICILNFSSKRKFDEHQAEDWWSKNKDRVLKRYCPPTASPASIGSSSTSVPVDKGSPSTYAPPSDEGSFSTSVPVDEGSSSTSAPADETPAPIEENNEALASSQT